MAVLEWLKKLDESSPTILLLKDFHHFCEDPGILRMLKNLTISLRSKPHSIIISSGLWSPSNDLEEDLTILDLPLPKENEIKTLLSNIAQASNSQLDENVLKELTNACGGLSESRIRKVAARALAQRGQIGKKDLIEVLEEKRQSIARSEVLEYCKTNKSPNDVGGLQILKDWLKQRKQAFSEEAKDFGLPLPKGVLLVGPQGTGKTLVAKAIANSWSMPLLRLDVGRLFAGLVGASEARTRETIQRAEAMAPCILWIDEIDKAFGGDGRSDGGTSQRVLANILTWMSEKTSSVFLVATANGIDKLPPELLRKGRFDEIFMLELPSRNERHSILELHLQKRRPNLKIDLNAALDRTEGFSGAELEDSVSNPRRGRSNERQDSSRWCIATIGRFRTRGYGRAIFRVVGRCSAAYQGLLRYWRWRRNRIHVDLQRLGLDFLPADSWLARGFGWHCLGVGYLC